ncbi:MAG: hypothetical protein O6913_10650 [Chloroflexi bacterium]|nr:hypothetical protein [Chloroflexota bacterium]
MQFRHVFLTPSAQALLGELLSTSPIARETLVDSGLAFDPPLSGAYLPQDLVVLVRYGLVAWQRERDDWRVAVTLQGRDYAADIIPG